MRTLTDKEWNDALLNTQGGVEKYPWHNWLDGRPHMIERGIDYRCSDMSFRKNLYRKQDRFGEITCLTHPKGFLIKLKRY